jgi:methylase of polypeptide subunit release factors
MAGTETYTLRRGSVIAFDRERHCPPDVVSEAIGADAAGMAAWYRLVHDEPGRPVRLLVPGIGTGIDAAGFIEDLHSDPDAGSLWTPRNVSIDAFDIDPASVETATENITRQIERRWGKDAPVTFRCFEGDWSDPGFMGSLPRSQESYGYTHILVNPPYAKSENEQKESMRPGYEVVPEQALFGGPDGAEHYRQLAPKIPAMLTPEPGAGATVRLPRAGAYVAGEQRWPILWGPGVRELSAAFHEYKWHPFHSLAALAKLAVMQSIVSYEMVEAGWPERGVEQRVGSWMLLRWTDTADQERIRQLHDRLTSVAKSEGRYHPTPPDDWMLR